MSIFSIGDIEAITGIKPHTIRVWEQRYDLVKAKRTETNIRYYDDDDLRLLLNVSILSEHGYRISEIAKMSMETVNKLVTRLQVDPVNYPCQVQSLSRYTLELNKKEFKKVLAQSIRKMGMEQTMIQIVYPLLYKLGNMWQTGVINPAQEHFATNLIKQKLITCIDSLTIKREENAKKFLLFLPPGEFHEIGLLFSLYLLKSKGFQTLYLGQNLTFRYIQEVFRYYNPDYLLSVLTNPLTDVAAKELIKESNAHLGGRPYLLAGPAIAKLHIEEEPSIHLLRSVEDLDLFIAREMSREG